MSKKITRKWLSDYEAFLKTDTTLVPDPITARVFTLIKRLLHPRAWTVFFKILGIHLVFGSLSLSICHQFEMNPFGTEWSLDSWVMSMWGHSTCMVVCGVFFVGLSLLSSGYLLTVEEVKTLKRTELLQVFTISAISLIIFIILGAEVVMTVAGFWLFGAFVGGILATETLWRLKGGMIPSRVG